MYHNHNHYHNHHYHQQQLQELQQQQQPYHHNQQYISQNYYERIRRQYAHTITSNNATYPRCTSPPDVVPRPQNVQHHHQQFSKQNLTQTIPEELDNNGGIVVENYFNEYERQEIVHHPQKRMLKSTKSTPCNAAANSHNTTSSGDPTASAVRGLSEVGNTTTIYTITTPPNENGIYQPSILSKIPNFSKLPTLKQQLQHQQKQKQQNFNESTSNSNIKTKINNKINNNNNFSNTNYSNNKKLSNSLITSFKESTTTSESSTMSTSMSTPSLTTSSLYFLANSSDENYSTD